MNFCDSKVVLGYIYNETKRFIVYVHNTVQRIRQSTQPDQWRYVPTGHNPADHASWGVLASQLTSTSWFCGPAFLLKPAQLHKKQDHFEQVASELDVDVRPVIRSFITQTEARHLTPKRFERFSTWNSLLRGIAFLIHVARSFKTDPASETIRCTGWHRCICTFAIIVESAHGPYTRGYATAHAHPHHGPWSVVCVIGITHVVEIWSLSYQFNLFPRKPFGSHGRSLQMLNTLIQLPIYNQLLEHSCPTVHLPHYTRGIPKIMVTQYHADADAFFSNRSWTDSRKTRQCRRPPCGNGSIGNTLEQFFSAHTRVGVCVCVGLVETQLYVYGLQISSGSNCVELRQVRGCPQTN